VSLEPLHRSLDVDHTLTSLASQPGLAAATNGMYFDYPSGPPVVPYIRSGRGRVFETAHQPVAGIGRDGRLEAGDVWLVGSVTDRFGRRKLVALNEVNPPHGLTLYTGSWGARPVPFGPHARSLVVHAGVAGARASTIRRVGPGRQLLVANGAAATQWIETIHARQAISIATKVGTTASAPFVEAFGTGTKLVAQAGHARTDLYCRSSALFVPRTSIGWTTGGTMLILVVVSVRDGTHEHGLDENQMSDLLVELGAAKAFALDGGGSSEMVTRRVGTHSLVIRGEAANSHQRPMPVGVGVFAQPPP
jgi:hypothetical protein